MRLAVLRAPATAAERAAVLPGDGRVSPADVVMDRGFALSAPPSVVWPWLVQLGKHRAGWYLPRRVERLLPRSRRALRHVDADLLRHEVGDVIPDWGGPEATFTLAEIETEQHLLYTSTRGRTDLTWCLQLSPHGGGTRVHLRLRLAPVKHTRIAESVGGLFDMLTVAGLAVGLSERVR